MVNSLIVHIATQLALARHLTTELGSWYGPSDRYVPTNLYRAHLVHDLRPYVCTYEHCSNPDQLYDRRADWVHHEDTHHRMSWTCPKHPHLDFSSPRDLQEHLNTQHTAEDAVLLKATSLGIIQNAAEPVCPICSTAIKLPSGYQDHVAVHLERLATFSLPRSTTTDEDDVGEGQSNDADIDQVSRGEDFQLVSSLGSFPDPAEGFEDEQADGDISGGDMDKISTTAEILSLLAKQGARLKNTAWPVHDSASAVVDIDALVAEYEFSGQQEPEIGERLEVSSPPATPALSRHVLLDRLLLRTSNLREKITALVDHQTHPAATLAKIAAYKARLAIHEYRINKLKALIKESLSQLFKDWPAFEAGFLQVYTDELSNATSGARLLFVDNYDHDFETRETFTAMEAELNAQRAELRSYSSPSEQDTTQQLYIPDKTGYLCSGAKEILNYSERGYVSRVNENDILDNDRIWLAQRGGAFFRWRCSKCNFSEFFHTNDSMAGFLDNASAVPHHGIYHLEHKARFLAKSHLHQSEKPLPTATLPAGNFYYGCLFCFTTGLAMGVPPSVPQVTAFKKAKELMDHITDSHFDPLPSSLLLERLWVGRDGKFDGGAVGWDLNLLRTHQQAEPTPDAPRSEDAADQNRLQREKVASDIREGAENLRKLKDAGPGALDGTYEAFQEREQKLGNEPDETSLPVLFTDALGWFGKLPYERVRTWEGMKTLIVKTFDKFENLREPARSGKFYLLDSTGDRIRVDDWEEVVKPGSTVSMAFLGSPAEVETMKQPVHFVDPTGRQWVLSLDQRRNWGAVEWLIFEAFADQDEFSDLVEKKQYDILAENGGIIHPELWGREMEGTRTVRMRWKTGPLPEQVIKKSGSSADREVPSYQEISYSLNEQQPYQTQSDAADEQASAIEKTSDEAFAEAVNSKLNVTYITPKLWESYKDEITELYLHTSQSLEEIRKHMREAYGFEAT